MILYISTSNTGRRLFKSTAFILLISFLTSTLAPLGVAAVIMMKPAGGGVAPTDPAVSVNPFTGGMSYSIPSITIPGPQGSGYSLSLNYQSGASPDDDASWVGYGWSLDAGSIIRNKQGIPDDMKDFPITQYQKSEPSRTITAGFEAAIEVFQKSGLGIGASTSLRHNNLTGFALTNGFFTSLWGVGGLNLEMDSQNGGSWGWSFSPLAALLKASGSLNNNDPAIGPPAPTGLLTSLAVGSAISMTNAGLQNRIKPDPPKTFQPYEYDGDFLQFRVGGQLISPDPASEILVAGASATIIGSYSRMVPRETISKLAYGYMYSAEAKNKKQVIMDYSTEKDRPYRTSDHTFLPMPFSSFDQFIATGNGNSGTFRLHHNKPGSFRPAQPDRPSELKALQGGLEIQGGPTSLGVSVQVTGNSSQKLSVGEWNPSNLSSNLSFDNSSEYSTTIEPYFFRFMNDMGGSVELSNNDNPIIANTSGNIDPDNYYNSINRGQGSSRSRYIGFNTIAQMQETKSLPSTAETQKVYHKAYTKTSAIRTLANTKTTDDILKSSIGEFSIIETNGMRYTYGLPVYSRNEVDISYSTERSSDNIKYQNSHLSNEGNSTRVNGEKRTEPYATGFLLTEIVTPDYIDKTNNGPTPDDLGGYTKFNYRRAYGTDKKDTPPISREWYKWRSPYNGLSYQAGRISDKKDDMGSVSYGEKEVYYLESIETKTHVAYFVTNLTDLSSINPAIKGSQSPRRDAFQSNHSSIVGNEDEADGKMAEFNPYGTDAPSVQALNKIQYLEQIQLYPKDGMNLGPMISATHFYYDYSIMKGKGDEVGGNDAAKTSPSFTRGLPNSDLLTPDLLPSAITGGRFGKLTLKKVWTETKGTFSADISPYEFSYLYPTTAPSDLPTVYQTDYYSGLPTEAAQTPIYSRFNRDRWGSYRSDGYIRERELTSWVDQTPETDFDPAAWQLKVVRTPTGSETHIQYEQNEYAYVQDKRAMAMVSLTRPIQEADPARDDLPGSDIYRRVGFDNNKYYLNITTGSTLPQGDIHIGNALSTASEISEKLEKLKQILTTKFIDDKERIYFKFLYQFGGAVIPTMAVNSAGREYIMGYAVVKECGVDPGTNRIYIKLGKTGIASDHVPLKAATDYVTAFNTVKYSQYDDGEDGEIANEIRSLASALSNASFTNSVTDITPQNTPQLIFDKSFLRLPILESKKGGGIRVKRLLTYIPSVSSGDLGINGQLYGSEYVYTTIENGQTISSGVATTEPGVGREENSIVVPINDKSSPEVLNRVISGDYLAEYVGPIGESLLPAPRVGYSKVIVKNIRTGESTDGYSEYQYHTVKDYPSVEVKQETQRTYKKPPVKFFEIFQHSENSTSSTQGYSFILRDMHGAMKSVARYGGRYSTIPGAITSTPFESQEYEYFTKGEKVPLMTLPDKPLRMGSPGKEMEIIAESRHYTDVTQNVPFRGGVLVRGLPWYLSISGFPYFYYKSDELKLHVITKTVSYPAIIKKVKSKKDGQINTVENIAFDPGSGRALLTRTNDGYNDLTLDIDINNQKHDGNYYHYSYPAYHNKQYASLGQLAGSQGLTIISHKDVLNTPIIEGTFPLVKISASATGGSAGGISLSFSYTPPTISSTFIEFADNAREEARGNLQEILRRVTPGDLVELCIWPSDKTKPDATVLAYVGNLISNGITSTTPTIKFDLQIPSYSSGSVDWTKCDRMKIIRSNKSNQLGADESNITIYGDNEITQQAVNNAINYANELAAREGDAVKMNEWLEPNRDLEVVGYSQWLSFEQTLTWHSYNNEAIETSKYDVINHYLFNAPPEPGFTIDNPGIAFNGNKVKNGGVVVRADVSPVRFFLSLYPATGWLNIETGYYGGIAYEYPQGVIPGTGIPMRQELPFTGRQRFQINDFGQLILYSYMDHAQHFLAGSSDVSFGTKRNLNYKLRRMAYMYDYNSGNFPSGPQTLPPPTLTPVNSFSQSANVIAANAMTYSDNWPYYDISFTSPDDKSYEHGQKGQWRPHETYQFNVETVPANPVSPSYPDARNYSAAGAYTAFTLFTPNPPSSSNWMKTAEITAYSANGEALTSKDALDISSTVKINDKGLPLMTVHNATKEEIDFRSFEATGTSTTSHAGNKSFALTIYETVVGSIKLTPRLTQSGSPGVLLYFWFQEGGAISNALPLLLTVKANSASIKSQCTFITRTGKWSLYRAEIATAGLTGPVLDIIMKYNTTPTCYIDDVRIHPKESEATCYVYNNASHELMATFNSDHFGIYNQYDGRGYPIRRVLETAEGYKTIEESVFHLPRKLRPVIAGIATSSSTSITSSPSALIQTPGWMTPNIFDGNNELTPFESKGSGNFDVFEIQLSPEKQSYKIFGQDTSQINRILHPLDSMKSKIDASQFDPAAKVKARIKAKEDSIKVQQKKLLESKEKISRSIEKDAEPVLKKLDSTNQKKK